MKTVQTRGFRRAWVEVDGTALRRNYLRLSDRLGPDRRLLPMVKADGYGIGAQQVVETLRDAGPWGFGVATVDEGRAVREAGWDGRVVVFSSRPGSELASLVRHGFEPAVSSLAALERVVRAGGDRGEEVSVHLEVDTGMGRFGLPAAEAQRWAPRVGELLSTGPVSLASTFTHYHSADDDAEATEGQWRRFRRAVRCMEEAGLAPGPIHAANSAAAVRFPQWAGEIARPGVFLYGAGVPDGEPQPEAVVRVRARVLDVRRLPAGATVSYGATYQTGAPATVATLAIGYGDGLRRSLSNRGSAVIGGEKVPIVGRVCMDVTVVDVSGVAEVGPGDVATLLGRGGDERITLEEMAEAAGTIAHEVLTGFTRRLPREWTHEPGERRRRSEADADAEGGR